MNQLDLFGGDNCSGDKDDNCDGAIEIFYDKFDLTGRRCKRFKFNGEWYYVLADYAMTMGFRDAPDAQRYIDEEEVTSLQKLISLTTRPCVVAQVRSDAVLTTRHGLYQLAYKASRQFRIWVASLIDESLGVRSKTDADSRIAKEQRRIGSDRSTAKERAESRILNREIKYAQLHRSIWKGITEMAFPEIKRVVGPHPLDRAGAVVLCMGNLAKYKARFLGCETDFAACEEHSRGIASEFKSGSNGNYKIGVGTAVRKGKTVKIIDFVELKSISQETKDG